MTPHDLAPMGKKAVSLSDIARRLNTTAATVSRALRNDPRISEAMCRRARTVADALGYRPDPEAQRLMAHLRSNRQVRFVATLGLINDAEPGSDLYRDPYTSRVIAGAEKRARSLGYLLDEIRVGTEGLNASRVAGIIKSRSIRGLLVPPQAFLHESIPLPLDDLAIVAATAARPELPLHRVSPDHFANAALLLEKLIELGHTRIGLVTTDDMEIRQRHAPTAVYHWFVREARRLARIPPLNFSRDHAKLASWFHRHRPTAVLAPDSWIRDLLDPLTAIPAATSLVIYGNRRPGFSGLDEIPEEIGAAAVDLLTSCIQRGENGVPQHPKRLLIRGHFAEGTTTREYSRDGLPPRNERGKPGLPAALF